METTNTQLVTLEQITSAKNILDESVHCRRTPLLQHVQDIFEISGDIDLYLKLESMQVAGSFKIRGVINQFAQLPPGSGTEKSKLISMSAGNYGKAFAYLAKQYGLKTMLIMPETSPPDRAELIQKLGTNVEKAPVSQLEERVHKYVRENNMLYTHSYNDIALIAGHGSIGVEIVDDVGVPDVVLVCCGGGGLLSGVSAATRLSLPDDSRCRIYGVEPRGAPTMYESYRTGVPAKMSVNSIASGLAPPYAGAINYAHCEKFVDDILLVSDAEIRTAMRVLFRGGLVVEPSGAAAFAALHSGRVPDVSGKRVVVVITGGNVTPRELQEHCNQAAGDSGS